MEVLGAYKDNIFAFARTANNISYVTIFPLHLASICKDSQQILSFDWKDTAITLPDPSSNAYNLLSGEEMATSNTILIKTLFEHLPIAVLKIQQ